MDACYTSKLLDNKMHVGYGRKDFGLGTIGLDLWKTKSMIIEMLKFQ